MKQAERIYQSEALIEGWANIGAGKTWWFDTSEVYQKRYSLDLQGIPIYRDDESFTPLEIQTCTMEDICTIVLSQNKKRALVMVNSKLAHVKVLGGVQKDVSWEDYTREGLWVVKKHTSGFALEAVIINPNIKTLEKFKVVKTIIKKVVETRDYIQGGNHEPANKENPKD